MIRVNSFTTHEAYEALLKAQKATDRFLYQYDLCVGIKLGTVTKFHNGLEEELATLKKREIWAKHKILDLNSKVKVLDRFYDLKSSRGVKDMIFDFSEMVDKFLYEMEELEAEAK